MITTGNSICDPLRAILGARGPAVLAVIAGVRGPSYRPLGATMAIPGEGSHTGSLSSGCVESDIALHAARILETGQPEIVSYGKDSPYVDIQLPCGGGLDILLLPNPDRDVIADVVRNHDQRQACTLVVDVDTGGLSVEATGATQRDEHRLSIRFEPDIAFQVFGKGPAACTLAALVRSAGYPALLLSPDDETLDAAATAGVETRRLLKPGYPDDLEADDRTAIVLLFHDHDWDPPILADALRTPAFYIGAQGSRRARDTRVRALEDRGFGAADIERVHGPIGLIPSARDAGTLAVSVLAEVLAAATTDRA